MLCTGTARKQQPMTGVKHLLLKRESDLEMEISTSVTRCHGRGDGGAQGTEVSDSPCQIPKTIIISV